MSEYASGANARAMCDVCGFEYRLRQLRPLTVRNTEVEIRACPACWCPDNPQDNDLPYVVDPQAIRNPRPDTTYRASGLNAAGYRSEGSRVIQWGWAPVGGARSIDSSMTPNSLVGSTEVGTVTVTTS